MKRLTWVLVLLACTIAGGVMAAPETVRVTGSKSRPGPALNAYVKEAASASLKAENVELKRKLKAAEAKEKALRALLLKTGASLLELLRSGDERILALPEDYVARNTAIDTAIANLPLKEQVRIQELLLEYGRSHNHVGATNERLGKILQEISDILEPKKSEKEKEIERPQATRGKKNA